MKYLSENINKVKEKTVLLRLDLNEDVDEKGKLLDDFRLRAVLPTIKLLRDNNCKVIIISHRGRPEGKPDQKYTLQPIAQHLADLLKLKFVLTETVLPDYHPKHLVFHSGDLLSKTVQESISSGDSKDIIFLENIRFYPGEEKNDVKFSNLLAGLAEVYVNDAFAVCHRSSSSVVGVASLLPSYAGVLLSAEIKNLNILLGPKISKPFTLVMGGIKISDKAATLQHLGDKADQILLGGGLANLLLSASGYEVGKSVLEKESLKTAQSILRQYKHKIVLPEDVVVAGSVDLKNVSCKNITKLKPTDSIYDIGPQTILKFSKILKTSGTICWNGPLGYFEKKKFRTGTFSIAKIVGAVGRRKAFTVAGGGETVAAVRLSGQEKYIDHVSTGGGAMLEFLSGKKLPGIVALK